MISHTYKCIFIHIPKCAGSSIESALGHREGHSGRGGQDHRTIRMIERPIFTSNIQLSPDNCIEIMRRVRHCFIDSNNHRNKLKVTRQQFNSYFKFTIIRNPWSRALSWYRNVMRDDLHMRYYKISGEISFKQFLSLHGGKGMLRPQVYWLKSFDGSIPLDYIGRFENLNEAFDLVCKSINVQDISLPHKVKGENTDYVEYYDNESKDLIWKIYKEEIELFGYSFES